MKYEEFILDNDPRDFLYMTGLNFHDKGSYMSLLCPYHNNTKTPSASILLETGIFKCFSCGEVKSFFTFLKDHGVAIDIKSEREVSDIHLLRQVRRREEKRKEVKLKKVENFFDDNEIIEKYLARRGGSKLSRDFLGALYDKEGSRIIFPIKDKLGNILSYERRTVGKSSIKVLYDSGSEVNKSLYQHNKLDTSKSLHLVEGMMDMIPLIELGFTNLSHTFGSNISKDQINELNTYSELVLYLDGDEAGLKWLKKILNDCNCSVSSIYYMESEDPNSIWVKNMWDTYLSDCKFSQSEFVYQVLGS